MLDLDVSHINDIDCDIGTVNEVVYAMRIAQHEEALSRVAVPARYLLCSTRGSHRVETVR